MRLCRPVVILLAAMAAVSSALSARAESTISIDPATQLANALAGSRYAMTVQDDALRGPGAERLLADARAAQFVLVGEDHGFVEVPVFTQALYRALAPTGFRTLVLEIGPLSAARAESALRADARGLARLDTAYPFALPFLGWREEGALAAAGIRDVAAPALVGVDQEFMLSPRMHFMRLAELAPDKAAQRLAEEYARRDSEAYQAILAKHDPEQALLPRLGDQDFAKLRRAFAGAAPEAREIVNALADSAAIYRTQQTAPYASNRARSWLMKRNFMARYATMAAREKQPRMLFKMGAYHVGRGISPTHQFDIGNLASELAESNGAHSYHVLVIAAGGTVNRWLPFIPDASLKQAAYDAHAELDPLGAGPLIDHALSGSWTLFDLAALRTQPDARKAGGPAFDRLIYAYDAAIVIDAAHAAHSNAD